MTLPIPTSDSIGHLEHHSTLHEWYNEFQPFLFTGAGTPEAVITAEPGTLYLDTIDGHVYHKQNGSGNTGWERLLDTTDTVGGGGGGGTPDPHAESHELLGSDVINIANMIEDGDPQADEVLTWDGVKPVWEPVPAAPPPGDHAATHAFGGGDDLSVEDQINDTPAADQVVTWDGTKAVWAAIPGSIVGGDVPDGGTAGQVLAKDSATNQDVSWYPLFNQSDNGVRYVKPGASGNGFSPWNPMGSLDNALSDVDTGDAKHIELVEPGTYTISNGATITGVNHGEFSLKARFQQPQRRHSQATTQGGTIIRTASTNQQHVLRISPANSGGPNNYGTVIEGITFNPADVIAPSSPTIAANAQATGNINGAIRFEGCTFWEVRRCTFGLQPSVAFRPVYLVVSTNVNAAGALVTSDGDTGSWAIFERNTGWGTCALFQNHSNGGGGNRMQVLSNVFSGLGGSGTTIGAATRPIVQFVGGDAGDELFTAFNSLELTNAGVPAFSYYDVVNAIAGPDGFERLGQGVGGSLTGNYSHRFQLCENILILGSRGTNSTFNIQDGGGNTGMRAVVANYTGPFAT